VSVTNTAGCTASDSTYLSLVNANIINNDTTICLGRSIKLSIDSIFPNRTACLAAQLPATMRDGLIAYYPFCGNANNALGTGNNGTVYNATLTTDRFGNSNSAYNFNGTNAYIDFGANPAIGPTTTIPISISLWINEGASGNVISKYTNLDASRSYFFFGRSSTEYSWVGNGTNPYIRNTTTPDNAWTHYVVIGVAGSNNSRVYRNGVLIATGTLAMNSTMQAISLLIGRLGGSFPGYLNGKVDDVFIFNRALSLSEIQSLYLYQPTIVWSNGATANSITVSPTQATTYYVDISDGINTCRDSVLVSVSDLTGFSPLSDTTRICGISATLNAGTGTYTYVWNTGATSQSITPTAGGFYKVTVTNQFGCTASDSTVLSLVNANILNRDTTICRGSSITLRIDSVFSGRAACNINGLPGNLRSGLLAYYPFCGSANDMSGNGNHGSVAAATLTADRFNVASCAYTFNGTNAQIKVNNAFFDNGLNSYTLSCWFKADRFLGTTGPGQVILNTSPHGGFALCYSRSTSQRRLSHWKSSNITTGWNIFADDLFSLNPANINLWYHVAIVKNGLNYQYYINGALDKSLTSSLATTPYLCSLIIGSIDGAEYFKGAIDDVFIYNRALSANEINLLFTASPSVSWSTGATSNSITVTPTQTTTYYVTVSDGVTSCIDSVHVTVSDIGTFDPLPDTTRICGTSTTLNAGTGTYTYAWNTGATSQSITPSAGGFYKVTVTNQFGCTASDSTVLSLVNANILNRDTTICRGSSVTLRIDSLFPGISAIDYDGNIYETVKIGNQNWIKSNLRTTRFSNGDLISNLSDISQWGTYSLPAWSYYSNNSLYNSVYGKLYNWYVASDTRNACPSGWRVSTDADWNILTKYLDLLADTSCVNCAASTTAAGHLKSIGISIWDSPNLGATNSSGFTSLPSGAIVSPGTFQYLGYSANYWTSSLFGVDNALFRNNVSVNASIWRGQEPGNIRNGLSIRCVKNENTSNISAIWSTGATSNSITVSPTQSTTYYVDVSDGITTCRDSIRINIADVDTSVVLLDPAQVCSNGGQVRMQAGFASSYQWLRNGTAISGATSRLYTATQSGIYRVALVNATGCVDTSRSITVTLNAQPVVGFNTASTTQCFSGNQFVFTNSSTISSGTLSYLWSFGNGATATQTNPSYSYPAAGTYQVKVVATSSNGCKDSTTRTVTVNASPTTVLFLPTTALSHPEHLPICGVSAMAVRLQPPVRHLVMLLPVLIRLNSSLPDHRVVRIAPRAPLRYLPSRKLDLPSTVLHSVSMVIHLYLPIIQRLAREH
jgi:uncharacterized protein (TIGR02145 family)